MSKPITLRDIRIHRGTNGFDGNKYTLILSDGTKDEVRGSFTDSDEQMVMAVANRLVELNQTTYEHAIRAGHVTALAKFKRAIIKKGLNSVHREKDLDGTVNELTKPESANLSFLRYHGLLVPDRNAPGGYWLLTTKGNEFLRGERTIPKVVIVKNNEVIGHEGSDVAITDIWKDAPFWPRKDELIIQRHTRPMVQEALGI